ncbi:Uu.00g015370.m01.CDS01 [Anthostomella pinea]|uniref:Uu.00g015370.m01.CDS01 n=1 Tax=Anthostomella pinea TaxID=933095 RepID=A0AAI8VYH5_9PEZI|nr:Uu.00g015370.m01.CDS01 [Anthostomella pinea]
MDGNSDDFEDIITPGTVVPPVPNNSRRTSDALKDPEIIRFRCCSTASASGTTRSHGMVHSPVIRASMVQHLPQRLMGKDKDDVISLKSEGDNHEQTDCDSDKWSIISIDSAVALDDDSGDDSDSDSDESTKHRKVESVPVALNLDMVNAKLCAQVGAARIRTPEVQHMRIHPRYSAKWEKDPNWSMAGNTRALATLASA